MAPVAVVMAAFNAEKWIASSLSSLQAQTVAAWRCVVVDDGSTDTTAAIVAGIAISDPRVFLVRQNHSGVAAARNRGLRELDPGVELVSLLDSDDLLLSDAFETLSIQLEARPDAVGVFGLAEYVNGNGEPVHAGVHPRLQRHRRLVRGLRFVELRPGEDSTFSDMALYGPIWPSAVGLHRRDAIIAAGGFDASLRLMSDWDLYVRMSRQGPFVMVDRHVAWYRRHHANLTLEPVDNALAHAHVARKTWLDTHNTRRQLRVLAHGCWRLRAETTMVLARTVAGALRRGNIGKARRASIALAWSAITLLRARPPQPSRHRIAYALAATRNGPDEQ